MMIDVNQGRISVPEPQGEVTLLDFLRDHLGLKGTKFGCGIGVCGACTVHADGEAIRACQVLVKELNGQKITTIEGLADLTSTEGLQPVQQAWIDIAVPQCGYCQAGQIMAAAALLHRNPDPSDAVIEAEMSGNLCRCGTYTRIRRAVRLAAQGGKS